VLDVFEKILSKPGADVNAWRPRIEHAQVFQPTDLQRIGKLGGSFESLLVIGYSITTKPVDHTQSLQAYSRHRRMSLSPAAAALAR
jgi:predicted amidohydrolase YtcJ